MIIRFLVKIFQWILLLGSAFGAGFLFGMKYVTDGALW